MKKKEDLRSKQGRKPLVTSAQPLLPLNICEEARWAIRGGYQAWSQLQLHA